MEVKQITSYLDKAGPGRTLCDPTIAFNKNFVPLDILYEEEGGESVEEDGADEPGKIWNWCEKACQDGGSATRRIEKAVNRLRNRLLYERKLHYCVLPAETDPNVAIDIFVETNKSSLTIKRFDIVVAIAQGSHGEDLRMRLTDYHSQSAETKYYFSHDEEKAVSEIGEWLLKVACLKANIPPKEQNYEKALKCLFTDNEQSGNKLLDELQNNLDAALAMVAKNGGLEAKGIPAFCPRARAYFEIPEVRDLVACFAVLFGWHGNGRGQVGGAVAALATYVNDAIVQLARRFGAPHVLAVGLQRWTGEIAALQEGEALDLRPADYFYHLLALDPFKSAVRNANTARNLAIFSQLLNVFQSYYGYTVVTHKNREFLRLHFFNSFLRLLYDGGINEYEDPDQPFPRGHVQVMTIHQAKGLEFPVVVVGSLSTQLSSPKQIDRDLGPFYHRPPFEPENRITHFDRMRLHYVAFSRPQKALVLTAHEPPKDHFAPIWQGLPQWPYVQKELLSAQRFEVRERMPIKKTYSFTGDLKIYETCPRQYQFFREYDFTPSRSAVIFFGLLLHQTIEEIHRIALDGKLDTLDEPRIPGSF